MVCGALQIGGIEPDAREYDCCECGADAVYGLEELAIMGRLQLTDAEYAS